MLVIFVRLGLWILVVALGSVSQALIPIKPEWRWLPIVVAVAGALGAGLTDSPSAARRIRQLRSIIRSQQQDSRDSQ